MVQVNFELQSTENVFIDYSGKSITSLQVNNETLNQEQIKALWIDGFLQLSKHVKTGHNKLLIKYSSVYNTDGDGLQSTINAQNKQYLYC